jgi:hypothetical protein
MGTSRATMTHRQQLPSARTTLRFKTRTTPTQLSLDEHGAAHIAFNAPTWGLRVDPRESSEVRSFAIFDAKRVAPHVL